MLGLWPARGRVGSTRRVILQLLSAGCGSKKLVEEQRFAAVWAFEPDRRRFADIVKRRVIRVAVLGLAQGGRHGKFSCDTGSFRTFLRALCGACEGLKACKAICGLRAGLQNSAEGFWGRLFCHAVLRADLDVGEGRGASWP